MMGGKRLTRRLSEACQHETETKEGKQTAWLVSYFDDPGFETNRLREDRQARLGARQSRPAVQAASPLPPPQSAGRNRRETEAGGRSMRSVISSGDRALPNSSSSQCAIRPRGSCSISSPAAFGRGCSASGPAVDDRHCFNQPAAPSVFRPSRMSRTIISSPAGSCLVSNSVSHGAASLGSMAHWPWDCYFLMRSPP
jgi:hypothetical protein